MYDTILAFMRRKGPCVPMEVANHLKKDSFLASAMLSELVQSGKVRMTNFTVGRSRLYYLPEHEDKLEGYTSYLNEKDQKTCESLRERKVLRDKDQDTLVRVSLRNIPDFAKAIEVTYNGEKHLFWKWFLVSDVEPLLKGFFDVKSEGSEDYSEEKVSSDHSEQNAGSSYEDSNVITEKKAEIQEPEERQESVKGQEVTGKPETSQPKNENQESIKNQETRGIQESVKSQETKDLRRLSEWSGKNEGSAIVDGFAAEVAGFLAERGVIVRDHTVQRKNSDIDLDVVIKTEVGELPYHCKARKKKQVNDGDISSAFVAGQMKKLPVLFVTTGILTKKAKEQLQKLPMTVVSMDGS
ncbi:MAG: hypothetical protein ACLFP2_05920 [Candidatus Woesearchaeota archaeon]